jgi:ATP-dependent DNA helicase DinG
VDLHVGHARATTTRLTWFTEATGLEDADSRCGSASPFDYPRNARLWVPASFPGPTTPGTDGGGRAGRSLAAALGGRTFVLTTTLRALPTIAEALSAALRSVHAGLEVLVQGSQPSGALLQRFGDGRGKVLVGSQSFWEGIDMPGDALQCVVIDKLPFPPPNDPLVEARVRQLEARQGNAFNDYFVAEAAISLKQGSGRLIRTETDRGLLVVCDPRLRR